MTLYINTSENNQIYLKIENGSRKVASRRFSARFKQAEKLLVEIEKLLNKNNLKLSDLNQIKVANYGHSFTSLRVGVVTANMLAYALGINILGECENEENIKNKYFSISRPVYDREPNITLKS